MKRKPTLITGKEAEKRLNDQLVSKAFKQGAIKEDPKQLSDQDLQAKYAEARSRLEAIKHMNETTYKADNENTYADCIQYKATTQLKCPPSITTVADYQVYAKQIEDEEHNLKLAVTAYAIEQATRGSKPCNRP